MDLQNKPNDKDLPLIEILQSLFKSAYCGINNAVKTDRLIFEIHKLGIITSGRDIRRVIGYIRRNDLLAPDYILSDVNTGYWLSSDVNEMNDFIDKMMNRMANQFQNVKHLHKRIRYNTRAGNEVQTQLF